ncbi:MAG: RDD family protein [Acidobacteria bacterium]|nr:RDD family protein [Acidobacteriota bacterium]
MSARAEKLIPAGIMIDENVVSGFDAEKLRAPFLLRCGALLIDYIVLAIVPVASLLLARSVGNDGAKLLNSEINSVGWVIMILLTLTNFLIFPMFSGQTIGKMVTGLRIAKLDGGTPGFALIILRHFVGYPVTLLTGGIGFIAAIFNKKGRALHDVLSGTVLVYGRKKVKTDKRSVTSKTPAD